MKIPNFKGAQMLAETISHAILKASMKYRKIHNSDAIKNENNRQVFNFCCVSVDDANLEIKELSSKKPAQ